MESELSCISARNKSEGYGELVGGYMFKCSLNLSYGLVLKEKKRERERKRERKRER